MSAHRRTRHSEDSVDADGAHERALAGHVGAADEEDPRLSADTDVVANTFCGWDKGVTELLGDETGRAFDEFGEGVGGMLVAVAREGEECFEFADRCKPGADRASVGAAPGLRRIGNLDYIHKRYVETAHDGVFERANVFHDGSQASDGL